MKDLPVMMILLALLAAAGTLAGVWLGRYLERSNEALKWRREHVLEAYTEFLRACAVVMDEADNIYHMELSVEHVAQGKLLFERVAEMYRLSDRVTLLGHVKSMLLLMLWRSTTGRILPRGRRKLLNRRTMNGGKFEQALRRSI